MTRIDFGNSPTSDPSWPLLRLTALLVEIVQANPSRSMGEPTADDAEVQDGAAKATMMEEALA